MESTGRTRNSTAGAVIAFLFWVAISFWRWTAPRLTDCANGAKVKYNLPPLQLYTRTHATSHTADQQVLHRWSS